MKRTASFLFLILLIFSLFILNLLLGTVKIPVGEVLGILFSAPSAGGDGASVFHNIIWSSRVPQVLLFSVSPMAHL